MTDAQARTGALGPIAYPGACVRCGRDGEHDFGDFWICTDCYGIAGATCSGLGQPTAKPPEGAC